LLNDDAIDLLECVAAAVGEAVQNIGAGFEREAFAGYVLYGLPDERLQMVKAIGLNEPADRGHVSADQRGCAEFGCGDDVFFAAAVDQQPAGNIPLDDPALAAPDQNLVLDGNRPQFPWIDSGFARRNRDGFLSTKDSKGKLEPESLINFLPVTLGEATAFRFGARA